MVNYWDNGWRTHHPVDIFRSPFFMLFWGFSCDRHYFLLRWKYTFLDLFCQLFFTLLPPYYVFIISLFFSFSPTQQCKMLMGWMAPEERCPIWSLWSTWWPIIIFSFTRPSGALTGWNILSLAAFGENMNREIKNNKFVQDSLHHNILLKWSIPPVMTISMGSSLCQDFSDSTEIIKLVEQCQTDHSGGIIFLIEEATNKERKASIKFLRRNRKSPLTRKNTRDKTSQRTAGEL